MTNRGWVFLRGKRRFQGSDAHRNKAFSLIELLVVIAIISLLVSILLPSLRQAKELAKNVTCLSNLRNIGTAMAVYTSENDGWFPYCAQNPFWGRPDELGAMPNLQVIFSNVIPLTEEFNPASSPFFYESEGLGPRTLPRYRSALWQCPNDDLNTDYYKYYGSSYIYISEFNGWSGDPIANPYYRRNFCYHRVEEVEQAAGAIILDEANYSYPLAHGNGDDANALLVDGHAESRYGDGVGEYDFKYHTIPIDWSK